MNQTTIRDCFMIPGGVGLHSGTKSDLIFYPAPADHGIQFLRSDLGVTIPANYRNAEVSPLCTTIQAQGAKVTTIEHLLSVCNGLGLDNLLVELQSEEVPILDGSGVLFFEQLTKVGFKELDQPRLAIRITQPVAFSKGDITIYATPAPDSVFTFSIDFAHAQIGQQEVTFQLNAKNYGEQIVRAKTFCMKRDIPRMRELGLIKGGTEENAIILNDEGQFENIQELTWLNEPNLHKILDQIGDFYLADNRRILGNVFSHKSGHASHLEFIRHLMDHCKDSYQLVPMA